ncbi:hypothetical protein LCGC14_3166690, partial [marine sediment metagenome]
MTTSSMIACPGNLRSREPTSELSAVGNNSFFVINDCPERMRRAGHQPGGGWGYPENWQVSCSTCDNEAEVTQKLRQLITESLGSASIEDELLKE